MAKNSHKILLEEMERGKEKNEIFVNSAMEV